MLGIMFDQNLPVTVSPSCWISLLVFVYENPTPTGDSKNKRLAAKRWSIFLVRTDRSFSFFFLMKMIMNNLEQRWFHAYLYSMCDCWTVAAVCLSGIRKAQAPLMPHTQLMNIPDLMDRTDVTLVSMVIYIIGPGIDPKGRIWTQTHQHRFHPFDFFVGLTSSSNEEKIQVN